MHLSGINFAHCRFALVLGLLGFMINLLPIPLFANIHLILGNVTIVIVAILLGPWYALITALLSATGLVLVWSTPYAYILFSLEAIILGFARLKDIRILYASALYWVFIGMPVFGLFALYFTDLPTDHIHFTTMKQAVNGILYAALAELCVVTIPFLWRFKGKLTNSTRRLFSSRLNYLFILMITVCLLISSLIFNRLFVDKQQLLINRNIQDIATVLAHSIENYLDDSEEALVNTAQFLSQSNPLNWQNILSKEHDNRPRFVTMLIANPQGTLVNASIKTQMLSFNLDEKNVLQAATPYLMPNLAPPKTVMTPAQLHPNLSNDVIVGLSTPIFATPNAHDATNNITENSDAQIIGILESHLDLSHISKIDEQDLHDTEQGIILVDDTNKILYASQHLHLTPLSPFTFSKGNKDYKTLMPLMNINKNSKAHSVPEYVYTEHALSNGWHIYVIKPFAPLLASAEQQYISTFLALLGSLLAVFFLSKATSRLLTEPLSYLANHFRYSSHEKFNHDCLNDDTPAEVYSLYESLEANQNALLAHQAELAQKVQQRTQELEDANAKLKLLAERDPLTQLYNRRYSETQFQRIQKMCVRSKATIAVAIMDLDFFKKVNDSYGHLGGDECLKVMASTLSQHFKRETDLVARYGGEEFLLILPIEDKQNVEQHLNDFRLKLAEIDIINPTDQTRFNVSVSIGAVFADANLSEDLDVWIKQADDNLYLAKHQGRNRVICTQGTQP